MGKKNRVKQSTRLLLSVPDAPSNVERPSLRGAWEAGLTKETLTHWSRHSKTYGANVNKTGGAHKTRKKALHFAKDGLAGGLAAEMDESIDLGWEDDRITGYLIFCSIAFTIGSAFLFGYNLCNLNTPALMINETFFMKVYASRYGTTVDDKSIGDLSVILWQITISAFIAGCTIGCIGSAFLNDKLGRRDANVLNQIPAILSGILSTTSYYINSPVMLIISRFLVGITAGAGYTYVSAYLIEIAPTKHRGGISSIQAIMSCLGTITAQILSMPQVLGTHLLWPYLTGFNVIPATFSLVLLPFCVESPRYLFIIRNDRSGAEAAWRRLLGRENVEDRIKEMGIEKRIYEVMGHTIIDFLRNRNVRWPLFMAIILRCLPTSSGIDAVQTYSGIVFYEAGVKKSFIPFIILGLGIVNLLAIIAALLYVDRLGRRKFLLFTCGIVVVTFFVLSFCLVFEDRWQDRSTSDKGAEKYDDETHIVLTTAIVSCIMIYQIGFSSCLASVPVCLSCEIFQQGTRTAATTIAQVVSFLWKLILSATFLSMNKLLGPLSFIPFVVVVAASFLFIFVFVPETKDKSFEEINSQMKGAQPVIDCCRRRAETKDTIANEEGDANNNNKDRNNNNNDQANVSVNETNARNRLEIRERTFCNLTDLSLSF